MNALSGLFDRIAVINLPYRTDRRAEMAGQLVRVGLNLDAPPVVLFEAVRPAEAEAFPSVGARGCFLSHLGVLRAARADRIDRLLILEDDCDFAEGSTEALLSAWRGLDASGPWDICYGGYRLPGEPRQGPEGWTLLSNTDPVSTTHCIGFSAAAIQAALPYLEAMLNRPAGDAAGGPMHVDGAYTWLRRDHPKLRTVAAIPPIAFQRPSRTDIHDLRWFDRLSIFRPAGSALRRAKARRSH